MRVLPQIDHAGRAPPRTRMWLSVAKSVIPSVMIPDWVWAALERALDLWQRLRGRPLNRAGLVLIIGAVALESDVVQLLIQVGAKALKIDGIAYSETPHFVVLTFVVAAVVLLVTDRFVPEKSVPPNPHDIELYRKFAELFDDDVMYFLRNHDFGNGFNRDFFKTFDELHAGWVGPHYEFEDSEMAEVWSEIVQKDGELTRLIALNTTPARDNSDWCRPYWTDHDVLSEKTEKTIKLINDTATALTEHINRLGVIARRKQILPMKKSTAGL